MTDSTPSTHKNTYNCVACGHPVHNLIARLGKSEYALESCPACSALCDPYLETDTLSIFLDLVLARKSAYRHLLFNRGYTGHLDLIAKASGNDDGDDDENGDRLSGRRITGSWFTARLGVLVILASAYLAWSQQVLSGTSQSIEQNQGRSWLMQSSQSENPPDLSAFLLFEIANTIIVHFFLISTTSLLLPPTAHHARPRWRSISEALFLSSTTRLFFMSLSLIWPRAASSTSEQASPTIGGSAWGGSPFAGLGLPSLASGEDTGSSTSMNTTRRSLTLSHIGNAVTARMLGPSKLQISLEDVLLTLLDLINRSASLSVVLESDTLGFVLALASQVLTLCTAYLFKG